MSTIFWVVIGVVAVILWALWQFPKLRYRARDAKGWVNDKVSDPVKDHKHQLTDAKTRVDNAKDEITEAITANKGLEDSLAAALRSVEKYDGLAKKAASDGNTEALTKFVKEKQRQDTRVESFTKQIAVNKKVIEDVRARVSTREDQIEDATANTEVLEAQLAGASLRQDMAKAGTGLGDLGGLGDLEAQVNKEENRAEALEEVHGTGEDNWETKYSKETSVDDETAKYLAEAGK